MSLNIIDSILQITIPFRQVSHHQMSHNGSGTLVETLRIPDLAFEDLLVDAHGVFVSEGVNTSIHFINEDP